MATQQQLRRIAGLAEASKRNLARKQQASDIKQSQAIQTSKIEQYQKQQAVQSQAVEEAAEWEQVQRMFRKASEGKGRTLFLEKQFGKPSIKKKIELYEKGLGSLEFAEARKKASQVPVAPTQIPIKDLKPEPITSFKRRDVPLKPEDYIERREFTDVYGKTSIIPQSSIEIARSIEVRPKIPTSYSVISPYKPEYSEQYYDKPFFQAVKEATSISISNIKERDVEKFRSPYEAFKDVGKRVGEVRSKEFVPIMRSGTILSSEKPYPTYGKLQQEKELLSEVRKAKIIKPYQEEIESYKKDLQSQVTKGAITKKQAENLLSRKVSRINIELDKELGKIKQEPYYSKTEQRGAIITKGASLFFSTAPLATPVTSALAGAYRISEVEKKAPIVIDIEKPLPRYPDVPVGIGDIAESSLYFTGAIGGAFGKIGKVQKELVKSELVGLEAKPYVISQTLQKTKKGIKLEMIGKKAFRGLEREIKVKGTLIKEEGKYFLPTAEAEVKTFGKFGWNILGGKEPTRIVASDLFEVGARGVQLPTKRYGQLTLERAYIGGKRKVLREGRTIGFLSKGVSVPKESVSLLYQLKQPTKKFARFSLSFKGTGQRYVKRFTEKEIKKSGEYIGKALVKGRRVSEGDIIKELSIGESLKLSKSLYYFRTPEIELGVTKILPSAVKKEAPFKFIKTLGIKPKTPLSVTFPEVLKVVKKPSIKKLKPKVVTKPIPESIILPPLSKSEQRITKELTKTILETKPTIQKTVIPTQTLDIGETRFSSLVPDSKMDLGVKGKFRDLEIMDSRFDTALKTKVLTKTKEKTKEAFKTISETKLKTLLDTREKQKQLIALKQAQVLKQALEQKQRLAAPPSLITKPSIKPSFRFGFPTIIPSFKTLTPSARARVLKAVEEKVGYNVYAKHKKKWEKLNTVPLKKDLAKDLGSYVTDTSLGAQFKITKTSKPARKSKLSIPKNYYRNSANKFRDYRISKKKKIPLKNKWIEKRANRLDHFQETRNIIQARRSLVRRR